MLSPGAVERDIAQRELEAVRLPSAADRIEEFHQVIAEDLLSPALMPGNQIFAAVRPARD
jgi:hypothetical protein